MAKVKVPADNPRGLLAYTNELGKTSQELHAEMATLKTRLEVVTRNVAACTWHLAIDRLRTDLEYLVGRKRIGPIGRTRPGKGTVEVSGPAGLCCTIYVTVRPTTRSELRTICVRPVSVGTPEFHLAIVDEEASTSSPPNSIAAINGMDYKAKTPVRSARHLLRVMEQQFKKRKQTNADR